MTTPWLIKLWRMSFIIVWKVAGELQRLKNITQGLYSLWLVAKVAFHLSPSRIWTLLKPHQRSSPVNHQAPWSHERTSDTRGSRSSLWSLHSASNSPGLGGGIHLSSSQRILGLLLGTGRVISAHWIGSP